MCLLSSPREGLWTKSGKTALGNSLLRLGSAFSLVELLVVLAVVATLASLLLPALGRAKATARSKACEGNLKQLQFCWELYAHDNNDIIPANIQQRDQWDLVNIKGSWVLGNAAIDTTPSNIEVGVLFPYVESADLYRCPADKSTVRDHPSLPRRRSYSIQMWLNSQSITGTQQDGIEESPFDLKKLSRIVDPPPSQAWVLIDEHEQSIDDGCFKIGNPLVVHPEAPEKDADKDSWVDFRGDRHSNGANLSFADGHVEHHLWRFHQIERWPGADHPPISDPVDRQDLKWLYEGVPHAP